MDETEIQNDRDTTNCNKNKDTNTSFFKKLKVVLKNITVEPLLILFLLPSIITLVATNDLNLAKACRVNLNLDENVCEGLEERDTTKFEQSDDIAIQKLVSTMNIWKTVIRSIFPAILLSFFGAWSDRTGRRKPCMVLPLIGEMAFCLGLLFCTYFFYEIAMEYTGLVEVVPIALTGSWAVMSMALYSYISGITTPETRTVRLGVMYICYSLSMTAGFSLSGILYMAVGFYGVFGFSLILYCCGLLYCVFVLKEQNTHKNYKPSTDTKESTSIRDMFNAKHFIETFKFVFKKREERWRQKIFAIIVMGVLLIGPVVGEFQVTFLYTRYALNWNELDFSIFFAYDLIVHMLGTMFSLGFFSKFLKLNDALLGIISCISKILGGFVYAFAPSTEIFYLGAVAEILSGTAHIALRSITSKIVPSEELGKINSLLGLFESLTLLLYGPLYSFVYKLTIDVFPGSFYLLGTVLTIPAILLFLWMYYEDKRKHFLATGVYT